MLFHHFLQTIQSLNTLQEALRSAVGFDLGSNLAILVELQNKFHEMKPQFQVRTEIQCIIFYVGEFLLMACTYRYLNIVFHLNSMEMHTCSAEEVQTKETTLEGTGKLLFVLLKQSSLPL